MCIVAGSKFVVWGMRELVGCKRRKEDTLAIIGCVW